MCDGRFQKLRPKDADNRPDGIVSHKLGDIFLTASVKCIKISVYHQIPAKYPVQYKLGCFPEATIYTLIYFPLGVVDPPFMDPPLHALRCRGQTMTKEGARRSKGGVANSQDPAIKEGGAYQNGEEERPLRYRSEPSYSS